METKIVKYPPWNYPYHLCPVCGEQSQLTSRLCGKHMSVTYDSYGNVLSYADWVLLRPQVLVGE